MLLVVLVELGFGVLEVQEQIRMICVVSEHPLIRYSGVQHYGNRRILLEKPLMPEMDIGKNLHAAQV